ncbi:topoisomerase 1-associated factor 1 [Cryptococcus deuterogattii 99/473]|uniref:Unplaced genomic scaffold supercont1.8, whole genome shotgun sequence n=1 Tax=Cryptococcus deuterogattii Ram5 TaxID=1296110 RepID=A0A0D0V187_9TREE|nr:topoisomerase 1-associated factor 1 [Cryptococcus deuterogattii Ram5]KIY54753.1 topoisomerase 1-associated factor 1 [Cryptococcus deuterogattii 99/473]
MDLPDSPPPLDAPSPPHFLDAPQDRWNVFYPAVQTLVNALGGYEEVESPPDSGIFETVYRPGDSVLGVLKDLKKLWRKDDEDDERTVARCMHKAELMKELVAILVECAERGEWGRKVALVASALTWPIDVAQELKEIEDEGPVVTDYASLLRAQLEYKALFLKTTKPLKSILSLMVPCLAKPRKDEKDSRIISLGLHVVRNLLAIKDAVAEGTATGEKEEFAHLQSDLITQLDSLTYLQLFLSLCSCADKTDLNPFNVILLDILHLIFRGIRPTELAQDQERIPIDSLAKLLEKEKKQKALNSRVGSTRHSRFGTTIAVKTAEQRVVLHRQTAIIEDPGTILDMTKKKKAVAAKSMDDLTFCKVSQSHSWRSPITLLLIDDMSASTNEEDVEVAEILQHQLYYNYDILDSALAVVREYKNQSVAYLDSVIHFAYVLLRMLEKYSKTKAFMFIRKRKNTHKKRKERQTASQANTEREQQGESRRIPEEYGDEEEEAFAPDQDAPSYAEHAFTFQSFEKRFAQEAVVNTLLTYLERFLEFDGPEPMKRVVGLMHRQVVKAHAEGLYFKVSTLIVFRRILDKKHSLPSAPSSRDLITLITYILRKFFKHVAKEPFTLVEALSSKSRGKWKTIREGGSDDDDDGMAGQRGRIKEKIGPVELQFIKKHKFSWSQQMSIAFAIIWGDGHGYLIKWIVEVLEQALAAKQEIVLTTDGGINGDEDEEDEDGNVRVRRFGRPSDEAISKFTQFDLRPEENEQIEAVSSNPHFRLMLKLLSFDLPRPPTELDFVGDISSEELTLAREKSDSAWFLPANVLPSNIEASIGALKQYMEEPPTLDDDPKKLLRRKTRAPRRRRRSPSVELYDSETGETRPDRPHKKNSHHKRAKKAVETQNYKSAAFIEDSDDEDPEATRRFFENEERLRREMDELAAQGGHAMMERGVKRKRGKKNGGKSPNDVGVPMPSVTANISNSEDENALEEEDEDQDEVFRTTTITVEQKAQIERQKAQLTAIREMANGSDDEDGSDDDPELRAKRRAMGSSESGMPFFEGSDNDDEHDEPVTKPSAKVRRRVIDPDEDDES